MCTAADELCYEHYLSSSENVAWKNKFSSQSAC